MKNKSFYGCKKAVIKDKYGLTPRDYYRLFSDGLWTAETCAPRMRKDWTPENRTLGQCSITAFLMQDLFGGRVLGVPLPDGGYHCFNEACGRVFDLTNEQFGDVLPDYKSAVPQSREVHFKKEEKRERYELLKSRLFEKLPEVVETERLLLRPFTANDTGDIAWYLGSIDAHCFLSMKNDALRNAKKEARKRAADPEYYLAVVLKDTGKVIGEIFGSDEPSDPESSNVCDTFSICWMIGKDYQGKGFAFEAAKAYIDRLFNDKGFRRVYAYTEDTNTGSRALCEKLGMRQEGLFLEYVSFVNGPDGDPLYENTCQYAILKKEWNKNY